MGGGGTQRETQRERDRERLRERERQRDSHRERDSDRERLRQGETERERRPAFHLCPLSVIHACMFISPSYPMAPRACVRRRSRFDQDW